MLRNRKGFTLIELLIVVVIIGILAAIAIPKFASTKDQAKIKSVLSDVRNYMTAQEAYFSTYNTYGSSAQLEATGFKFSTGNEASGGTGDANSFALTVTNSSISAGAPANNCGVKVGGAVSAADDGVIYCPAK